MLLLFLYPHTIPHEMAGENFQGDSKPKRSRKAKVRPHRISYAELAWNKLRGRDVPHVDGLPIRPKPGNEAAPVPNGT
jgi:hypothetical protein